MDDSNERIAADIIIAMIEKSGGVKLITPDGTALVVEVYNAIFEAVNYASPSE